MSLPAVRAPFLSAATLLLAAGLYAPLASAQVSNADLEAMKKQIQEMQQKLDAMQAAQKAPAPAVASTTSAAPASAKFDGIQMGPVNLKFGGFLDFTTIYRNRNEEADVASSFNAVPFANSSAHNLNEFRESARHSRLSLLISGPSDGHQHAEGYYEMDFLGAAQTANSKESNSYNIRVRNVYGQYFNDANGFSMLAGQNWSLLTQTKTPGIVARSENAPAVLDSQYVPGFNWTRNPQIRFVEKFNKFVTAGLSFESPQGLFSGKAPTIAGVTPIATLPSGSLYNSANTYTFDGMPDIIAKVAVDPGYGHYELFALTRQLKDRLPGTAVTAGQNNTATGNGIGGSVLLSLLPKQLEVQGSFLTGNGIGRYGSAQLPDATYNAAGGVQALKGTTFLLGLTAHPTSTIDLYAYYGKEKVDANYTAITGGYVGYGAPNINLSGCSFEGGTCAPNLGESSQTAIGGTWKYYRGALGNMQLGLMLTSTKVVSLAGLNGLQPDTRMTTGMLSVRYYPYQN